MYLFNSSFLRHASPACFLVVLMLVTPSAFAAGSGMPWEGPLDRLIRSLTGPVAQALLTLAVLLLGFAFAFSEGAFMRRILGVVLGGAIAATAASFALDFFGFTSGATF